jgi:hypothetical protein
MEETTEIRDAQRRFVNNFLILRKANACTFPLNLPALQFRKHNGSSPADEPLTSISKKLCMKKFYLLTACMLCIVLSVFAQSVTSIHYWDFNTGSSGVANAKWPSPITATSSINSGVLTHNITTTEDFAGSTLDAPGFTTAAGGASFSAVGNTNNNNSIVLNVSTAGYQDIALTYATRGTATGFNEHVIEYSTDGTSYVAHSTLTGRNNTTFSLQTIDFTAVTAANNNPNFKIRITVRGATAAAGNNRFDNFRVTGNLATTNLAFLADSVDGVEGTTTAAQFLVVLNNPAPAGGVTVTYQLSGIAKVNEDYTNPSGGSITIPAGSSSGSIVLPVVNDAIPEGDEIVRCVLTSASNNYNFSTSVTTTTIVDDDAQNLVWFSFTNCNTSLSDGFTAFSTTGAEVWACTTFGNIDNAVQMNGFAGGAAQANEDWLISPALNLSATNVPLLSFYSRTKFVGPSLQLLVSTNYSGSGDPSLATWTEIDGRWPATHSDVWNNSQFINLSAFKQSSVHIAFRYLSNAVDGASRWTVDDIRINNALAPGSPSITALSPVIDFRQANFGAASAAKQFSFWANDLSSDLTITAPAGFELSKDGNAFSSSINFTPAETVNDQQTAWARFNPLSSNNSYSGYLQFNSASLSESKFFIKGNSYSSDQTLNVVNWNIEWFGSGAQDPADDNLAQANAKAVMEYLDADVFALAEIVDNTRLSNLVSSLAGGYSYVLGEFCSSGSTPAACASAQKLALVYKTSVVSNVTARPLFNNGVGSNAYTNWSSGRYPFLVNATVTKNGISKVINFIVLHAKALDDVDSYNRRKGGAEELKDTLDTYFSSKNVIILGDYNDDFDSSITAGVSPRITPYDALIKDSVDADSYRAITLPLSRLSLNSTYENAEMIDHVVVSNELANAYVSTSASLYNDIGALAGIANYANTTSDHYPVQTRFLMSAIIPVKLLSFEAVKQNSAVNVKWSTSRELNSKEFIVERSADGRDFTAIGKVAAGGNSSTTRWYQFNDASPLAGTNFYRLRIIDQDGNSELSKIARVYVGKEIHIGITPNPARNFVNVYVENNDGPSTIQLTDLSGRVVKQFAIAGGSQNISINIAGNPAGVYFVKLITAKTVKTEKLVIE